MAKTTRISKADPDAEPADDERLPARSALRENFESIIVAVLFAVFVRGFIAQPYKIPSGSMKENLLIGDHLVVNKVLYGAGADSSGPFFLPTHSVERGDIVIFRPPHEPETDYIKRVIGLPGETLQLRFRQERNSVVILVDGKPLPENYRLRPEGPVIEAENARWTVNCYGNTPFEIAARTGLNRSIKLGPGEYWMMGDNRNDSYDSRGWGKVKAERIRGKAWLVYWSYDGDGEEPAGSFLARVGYYLRIAKGFIFQSRWSRTFHPIQ